MGKEGDNVSRLKRLAEDKSVGDEILKEVGIDLKVARKSIDSLESCIDDILENYKSLFTKLNTIAREYPKLNDKLSMLISFPNEHDTQDVVRMKKDIDSLKTKYEDDDHLAEAMGIIPKNNP